MKFQFFGPFWGSKGQILAHFLKIDRNLTFDLWTPGTGQKLKFQKSVSYGLVWFGFISKIWWGGRGGGVGVGKIAVHGFQRVSMKFSTRFGQGLAESWGTRFRAGLDQVSAQGSTFQFHPPAAEGGTPP